MSKQYPVVFQHFSDPSHRAMADPKKYLGLLKGISSELAAYTERDLGARSFIHLTRNQFKSVEYCGVSALGSAPEDGRLATAIEPRRVVDPLMWVLEKS